MRVAEQKFRAAGEGNWKITRDEKTLLPRTIFGGKSKVYPGDSKGAAKAFLEEHKVLFGLQRKHSTIHHVESKTLKQGVRVTFIQRYRNLQVVDGKIQVLVDAEGRIIHSSATVWPVQDVSLTPKITPMKAIGIAMDEDPPLGDVVWATPSLAIYPKSAGRLVYLLSYQWGETVLPWEYAVDAENGELLEVRRRVKNEDPIKMDPPTRRSVARATKKTPPRMIRLGTAPSERRAPTLIPAGVLGPCDRQWEIVGLVGETIVTEAGSPDDQYDVIIDMGVSSFGSDEFGFQLEDIYGAGIQLLPCYQYTITYDWDLFTWDSYNFPVKGPGGTGYWDVFFVHVNSVEFWWNIVFPQGIAEHACDTIYNPVGLVDLPGPLWSFGGNDWDDSVLCSNSGIFGFTYTEPDTNKVVYLSVGLDTLITGDVDGLYPSWGTFNVLIEADTTKLFDPNPVTTLNDGTLADNNDANSATPCGGYTNVTLQRLNTPAAGQPWVLVGDYVSIASLAIPPNCTGDTPIAFTPPTSRTSIFPYLRDCDAFEGVMCYHHITQNQIYIQSLGFANINNRSIQVDPHAISEDNSFYCPDGSGTGSLFFGDGGVDDGEDADVILHEYGHSMQDNQNVGAFSGAGGFGFGDETGAIGEGFGDYWACSNFNAQNLSSGFNPAFFAEWDAPPMGLRQINKNKIYPAAMVNQIHTDGEIWSGALWQLFQTLGKTITDTRVLDSHFLVPNNPTFADNAEAMMFSEYLVTGGVNAATIAGVFADRGIFQRLNVKSLAPGAAITVGISDQLLDGDGTATFTRIYKYNEVVTLTAPVTHKSIAFKRWKLNGSLQPIGQVALNVTMTQTHTAIALYDSIPGDVDDDGVVNVPDLLTLLADWGPCPAPCPADIDGNGVVDVNDLLTLLANWG
ncbi:MAG: M36 family metallopeptidase [Planctomycetota bacterium]|nr:M36 family metallopeptidase [Planctomycetota bacterium]